MSHINISELKPVGANLFYDSESFLNELTDDDITSVTGGFIMSQVTDTVGYEVANANDVDFAPVARRKRVMKFTGIPSSQPTIMRSKLFSV